MPDVRIAYCNLFDERNSGSLIGPLPASPPTQRGSTVKARSIRAVQAGNGTCASSSNAAGGRASATSSSTIRTPMVVRCQRCLRPRRLLWLQLIAKNPVICQNGLAMMQHPAVVGAIVERGCGTPDDMATCATVPPSPTCRYGSSTGARAMTMRWSARARHALPQHGRDLFGRPEGIQRLERPAAAAHLTPTFSSDKLRGWHAQRS